MGKKSKRRVRAAQKLPQQEPLTDEARKHNNDDNQNNNNSGDGGGDHFVCRPFADQMIERFHLASSLYEHDVWNHERLSTFFAYSGMWLCFGHIRENLLGTDADHKFVRKVRRHRTQPLILRAEALWLSGWMIIAQNQRHLMDDAQEYFNEAVAVCGAISDEDKEKTIFVMDSPTKVGERISLIEKRSTFFDALHEKFAVCSWSPLDGKDIDIKLVGGLECDYCKKDKKQLGLSSLHACSRCNIAYYCTRECQEKAWFEGGHKKLCRKPGKFKPGDGAYITEAVDLLCMSERHVNEQGEIIGALEVVKTIQPGDIVLIYAQTGSGEFLITDREDGYALVGAEILRCCRPDLWRIFTDEDLEYIKQGLIAQQNQADSDKSSDLSESEGEGFPELIDRHPTFENEEG